MHFIRLKVILIYFKNYTNSSFYGNRSCIFWGNSFIDCNSYGTQFTIFEYGSVVSVCHGVVQLCSHNRLYYVLVTPRDTAEVIASKDLYTHSPGRLLISSNDLLVPDIPHKWNLKCAVM